MEIKNLIPPHFRYLIRYGIFGYFQKFYSFLNESTDADNCIVINGVPKSGTHLVHSIVSYFGLWKVLAITLSSSRWAVVAEGADSPKILYNQVCHSHLSIQRLINGQCVHSHLTWSAKLENVIAKKNKNRNIKHLMIYRDPRDVCISYINYVLDVGRREWSEYASIRDELLNLTTDQRLDRVIPVVIKSFTPYIPWLNSPYCHLIKFEDLYLEMYSLENGEIGPTMSGLLDYLGISPEAVDTKGLYISAFNKSATATVNKKKINQYKKYFKKQHFKLFKTPESQKVMDAFGYSNEG